MPIRRKCDIVLQGGVTSGVVYPGLVCELAKEYDFQSIGGTSAGAIAASLTAAAEYARRKGDESAFQKVAEISEWLGRKGPDGKESNLFGLFQPQPATKGLFKFAVAFLVKSWTKRLLSLFSLFWIEILVGIGPALLLGYLALDGTQDRAAIKLIAGVVVCFFGIAVALTLAYESKLLARTAWWFGAGVAVGVGILPGLLLAYWLFGSCRGILVTLLCFLICTAGIAITSVVGLVLRLAKLPSSSFGLCTGNAVTETAKAPALVPWLNDQINQIAGKASNEPLTFGDLQNVGPPDAGISLRMMTTCLTWGRPFTLPFQNHKFYFSPAEFRSFFPEGVVRWLESHPYQPPDKEEQELQKKVDTTGLCALPDWENLPVIVAARMSLSFPFLFCTVPLYAADFSLKQAQPDAPEREPDSQAPVDEQKIRPEHVWFTDGGICNNFPLHLFDAPVPTWPTFGVGLTDWRPDWADRTWIPTRNGDGILPDWTRLDAQPGLTGTLGLVFAIINAARNWVNSLQAEAPGYRDRIVHIALKPEEGGLDLIMPPELVKALSGYGVQAGQKLIDHFIHGTDGGKPIATTWDNQRWVRYRSTMALLEKFLAEFAQIVTHPEVGDTPYLDLIKRGAHDPPATGYRLHPEQIPTALAETERLIQVGNAMTTTFDDDRNPRPEPRLVIRPDF